MPKQFGRRCVDRRKRHRLRFGQRLALYPRYGTDRRRRWRRGAGGHDRRRGRAFRLLRWRRGRWCGFFRRLGMSRIGLWQRGGRWFFGDRSGLDGFSRPGLPVDRRHNLHHAPTFGACQDGSDRSLATDLQPCLAGCAGDRKERFFHDWSSKGQGQIPVVRIPFPVPSDDTFLNRGSPQKRKPQKTDSTSLGQRPRGAVYAGNGRIT